MKKRILTILACLLMLINVFAFSACGDVKGTFYSLEEAYEMGLLTLDDLLSIAYYINGGRDGNEELMPESYKPQPKNPEMLSEKTFENIEKSYISSINDPNYNKVFIFSYYGVYNGCIVLDLVATTFDVDCIDPFYESVELYGIKFSFFNSDSFKVWVEE